jgi:hypothetical protein
MRNTGRFVVVIWLLVVMYVVVIDPDLISLDITNKSSTGSSISLDYTMECDNDGNCKQWTTTTKVEEDSYPSMIPEIKLPEFEVTNDHFMIIGYGLLVVIAGVVFVIAWKKSKPVIELGEE